jgi:ribose 5-phosphate isomerase B
MDPLEPQLSQLVRRVVGRLLAPTAMPGDSRVPGVFVEGPPLRPIPTTNTPASAQTPPGRPGLVVAVGSDHGGFAVKGQVLAWLAEAGHRGLDLGTHDERPVDYPDFAHAVALAVREGRAQIGVCIDGAGIGSAMAANKVPGIRAANGGSVAQAKNAREHNYANVLTLGARLLEPQQLREILLAFLSTPWGEARHGQRVAKIEALEQRYSPSGPNSGQTSPRAF